MAKKNVEDFTQFEIDIEQLLLHSRNITLYDVVDHQTCWKVCSELLALDQIEKAPIGLWINTPGGHTSGAFGIIDTIAGIRSPVYTFVCGEASSAGALISLAGERRVMTIHSSWMMHNVRTGGCDDLSGKMITDRSDRYYKHLMNMVMNYVKKRTKLTKADLDIMENGELWLWANECLKKGIVHKITSDLRRKR
jgi:ATP-dependent Clp protease protease subunit